MNKTEALRFYKEHCARLAAYGLVLSTAGFDRETVAPKLGADYRNKALALMAGEYYGLETDPKFIECVDYLSDLKLDEVMAREIALRKKSLESTTKFTKEEEMEWNLLSSKAWEAWYEAKKKQDYRIFEPYLRELIDKSKKRAERRKPEEVAYNVLLDDYEEGMRIEDYDRFFALVKSELLPLIEKVNGAQSAVDYSFMFKKYPVDKQKKFTEVLLKHIGFDGSWGYMGVSAHPFTDGISRNDVRITTFYDEYSIAKTIYAIIHETGHAYFEHQVESRFDEMMIRYCISSGMHESQSRFLENYIGRRPSFWKTLYPKLQKRFKNNLGEVSLDEFVRAVSASRSSLIRTEADELTYPIHILIRYELEKGIFDGSIALDHLDEEWNRRYEEYLGVKVNNASEGILQDVHWSGGAFGYFPTYALGSAIGAQLLRAMEKDIDVDTLLEKGKIREIEKWLKKNVQHDGALHNYNEVLLRATGEEFNPQYYIDYLKDKYTKLYNL